MWPARCLLRFTGVSDEIHQSFILSRSESWFDFFKDVVGINVCFYFVHGALFT
ncbi:VanZ family protein [Bacillus sp. MUM 116]|uniref:VanZ family protein n=1 Tax=Bacillus sp. MUM 116 TaxID=1678002 RepID=UPI0015A53638